MSKRPSIIDNLELTPAAPEQTAVAAPAKVVPIHQAKPATADLVRSSIYLNKEAHRRLKEIALVEDKKVHDLIMEGIDMAIAKRGHTETAKRKPKPKA